MKASLFRITLIFALLLGGCAAPARSQGSPAADTPAPDAGPHSGSPLANELPPARKTAPAGAATGTPVTPAAPAATASPTSEAPKNGEKSFLDDYMPRRKAVAETEHFVFYAQDGYFPVDQKWWLEQSEIIYAYVAGRLGVEGRSKVLIGFLPPEQRACPVRGLAAGGTPPTVLIYADQSSQRPYLLAVLAHELGHAIPLEGFAGGLPNETALTEGLATWAAGRYWLTWKNVPSLDALVRVYLAEGQYEPLTKIYDMDHIYPWQKDLGDSQGCLARRDRVYSSWAAFIGYLVDAYGWDRVHQLFEATPDPTPTAGETSAPPSAYEKVFGRSLAQLEAEWMARVRREIAASSTSQQN